jgi:hypothetical protein
LVHLRDFITSGGKPQQAIKVLSEGYHGNDAVFSLLIVARGPKRCSYNSGRPSMCNLVAGWLESTGERKSGQRAA